LFYSLPDQPLIFFVCSKKTANLSEYIELSIPYELSKYAVWQRKLVTRYETNQLIRALDTWLVLKHETTSGYIQCWNSQKDRLLKICKCSESILRHRLKILASLKLLTIDRHGIHICSWQKLARAFDISIEKKLSLQYNINDTQKIHQWIIATEIEDNKQRQDFMIITKLNKNPEAKMIVTAALIAAGADGSQLDDMNYFLTWLRVVYHNDFIRVSDIHDVLVEIRPDNNRGVRGLANEWKCRHAMTISYWKKILKKNGIIDISSLQIQSRERARNRYCRVLWLKNSQQTLLCLCDQIEILKPWLITEAFKMQPAA